MNEVLERRSSAEDNKEILVPEVEGGGRVCECECGNYVTMGRQVSTISLEKQRGVSMKREKGRYMGCRLW